MAVYKVIQDIEAEDKLLGPLTLKGFVYAGVSAILLFICIRLAISSIPSIIKIVIICLATPPMVLFGVLASPLGREQPTEVWLLSRVKFLLKNRERKWDQSGTKELVAITVPKKTSQIFTKNISQTEVSSRLQALASTLDSRGWAIRNAALNVAPQVAFQTTEASEDRLATGTTLAKDIPEVDIKPEDDILDEQNNEKAQKVQFMMVEAEERRKQQIADQLEAARQEAQRAKTATPKAQTQVAADNTKLAEEKLLRQIHEQQRELTLHPPKIIKGATREVVMTPTSGAVKMELANYGNDLSVATIARLANSGLGNGATVGPL